MKIEKKHKINILLIIIFMMLSNFIATFNLAAQGKEAERGYKTFISKDDMLLKFRKNKPVIGYMIRGADIIDIIDDETDYVIKIKNSAITEGLDFTKLRKVSINELSIQKDFGRNGIDAFKKKNQHNVYHVVRNEISITDSSIETDDKNVFAVNGKNTLFYKLVEFTGTTFRGDTDFSSSKFMDVKFVGCEFFRPANFRGARFSKAADFSMSRYQGELDFSRAACSRTIKFNRSSFAKEVSFYRTSFNRASFSKTIFSDDVNFSKATFRGKARFVKTSFNKSVFFKQALFLDTIVIMSSNFEKYIDFREARINRINFSSIKNPTILKKRVDFRNATISDAYFKDLIFESYIDFSGVKFGSIIKEEKVEDDANEKTLRINKSVKSEAEKKSSPGMAQKTHNIPNTVREHKKDNSDLSLVFKYITFENDVYFLSAGFNCNVAFENVNFKRGVDFTDSEFNRKDGSVGLKFSLSYVSFKNLLITWDQIKERIKHWDYDMQDRIKSFVDLEGIEKQKEKGNSVSGKEAVLNGKIKLEPLSLVLNRLETSFRDHNQLHDANEAFYHMKNAELKEDRKGLLTWQWLPGQIHWLVWHITCGYGTKVYWIFGWCIFFNLLFSLIYSINKDALQRQPQPETEKEFLFKQRFLEFPRQYVKDKSSIWVESALAKRFINSIRFSTVILFKFGYRDTVISGKIMSIDYRYIVWVEWILGFYLLISLVITLSNTLPIIDKLVTGMF